MFGEIGGRKTGWVRFACALAFGACCGAAGFAEEEFEDKSGNWWTYELDGEGAIVTGFEAGGSFDGELAIPSELGGEPVVSVAFDDKLFKADSRDMVDSLALPTSVEEIGDGAFAECYSLAKVDGGTGLKRVGDNAFGSTALAPDKQGLYFVANFVVGVDADTVSDRSEVVLTNGVRGLAVGCFRGCAESGCTIRIPATVADVPEDAFADSGVTNLVFGARTATTESLTISGLACQSCDGLSGVSISHESKSFLGWCADGELAVGANDPEFAEKSVQLFRRELDGFENVDVITPKFSGSSEDPPAGATTYGVRFDKNAKEATGTMAIQTIESDKEVPLSPNAFARPMYEFAGWAKAPAGSVECMNGAPVSNLFAAGETGTLYAVWSVDTVALGKGGVDANGDTWQFSYDPANGTLCVTNVVDDGDGKVAFPAEWCGFRVEGVAPELVVGDVTTVVYGGEDVPDWARDGGLTNLFPAVTHLDVPPASAERWSEALAGTGVEIGSLAYEATCGIYCRVALADLGMELPTDFNAQKGDKVAVKVMGLPKGLKLVKSKADPTFFTIEGVPSETLDLGTQTAFARVTVTYKGKGKMEWVVPLQLAVNPGEPARADWVVGKAVPSGDDKVSSWWPDAAENPSEWSFKGWPAGVTCKGGAVRGAPAKAGVFAVTATRTHVPKGATAKVKETYALKIFVWGNEQAKAAGSFARTFQVGKKLEPFTLEAKSVSGLPSGLAFKSGTVSGTPKKAGVFAVMRKLVNGEMADPELWEVVLGDNPGARGGFADALSAAAGTTAVAWDGATAVVTNGAFCSWTNASVTAFSAKVSASGLPAGLKLVKDKTSGVYSIAGVPTKVGDFVVTLKTVMNGVTKVERFAIAVAPNPHEGAWHALESDGEDAEEASWTLGATVAAKGTVKVTLVEGAAKTSATIKCLNADACTATCVLPVNAKNPQAAAARRLALDFAEGTVELDGYGKRYLCRAVKPAAEDRWAGGDLALGAVTVTDSGAVTNDFADLTVTWNDRKSAYAVTGRLADGAAVKATVPVISDDGDLFLAPFLVKGKAVGNPTYSFAIPAGSADDPHALRVRKDGEVLEVVERGE